MRSSTPSRISGFAGTRLSVFTFKTYNLKRKSILNISPTIDSTKHLQRLILLTFPSGGEMTDSVPEVDKIFPSSQSPFES
jgi:hypothetical protein